MVNFLTLSLELRQQILTHAFDDAALRDLHFNSLLYTAGILWRNNNIDKDLLSKTIYTPNIYNLAATLRKVDPQLGLDMVYVLKQVLPKFESNPAYDLDHKWTYAPELDHASKITTNDTS